jgi:hypothetical protein
MVLHQNTSALPFFNHGSDTAGELIVLVRNALMRTRRRSEATEMDMISKATNPEPPERSTKDGAQNFGARQFEYAFVKRQPTSSSRGKSASDFVKCVCGNSYCVGSISCVGCVAELSKLLRTALLRTASSSPELRSRALSSRASSSVASALSSQLRPPQLRPVACQLRSCASPKALLSRMVRISRRAATAMKVKRTAERLAHLVELHQRALRELSKLSGPRHELSSPVSSPVSSSDASSELSSSLSRQCEFSPLRIASPSIPRPCELRPSELSASASTESGSALSTELRPKRESPLRRFALVASQSRAVKSASPFVAFPVVSLRPPKRNLH